MRTIISSRRSIFISRRPQQIQEGLADTSASVSARRRRRHLILHSKKAPRLAPCCMHCIAGGRFGSWSLVRWSGGRRRKQSGLLRGRHRWLQEVEVVRCAARHLADHRCARALPCTLRACARARGCAPQGCPRETIIMPPPSAHAHDPSPQCECTSTRTICGTAMRMRMRTIRLREPQCEPACTRAIPAMRIRIQHVASATLQRKCTGTSSYLRDLQCECACTPSICGTAMRMRMRTTHLRNRNASSHAHDPSAKARCACACDLACGQSCLAASSYDGHRVPCWMEAQSFCIASRFVPRPFLARALAGHGGSAMSRHVNVIQRKRRLKDVGITATGIATEEKRPNADRIQVR